MEKINQEELLEFTPDVELASTKGLASDGVLNDEYFSLQAMYASLLNAYLNLKLGISNIEQKLDSIGCRPTEDKDQYQLLSNIKYFYVRNNLYIEHLTKEQIQQLIDSNGIFNNETYALIETTFKDIIKTYNFNLDKFTIFYGPSSSNFQRPNDSLVIGYRFAEEDDSLYPSEEVWYDDYIKRYGFVKDSMPQFEKEWSRILNVETSLIQYDETCTLEHEQNKTATL